MNLFKVDIFVFVLASYSRVPNKRPGPPLGPPLEIFTLSGWVGAPPWVSLMWGPLEGPPLGPPLEIFSVSGGGRGPPSAPPQIYYAWDTTKPL